MRTFRVGYRILLAKEHEKALLESEGLEQQVLIDPQQSFGHSATQYSN
jgi:hypothetical protein